MDQLYERGGALTITSQFGYGVGHVLNDICASLWFTYFLVFFHLVLEFDANQAGILLLIGQITDGLATPFVGYFSDHTDNALSKRYGKRKLWHLFGTFSVLISFPFIFSRCLNCETSHKWAQMIYFSSFIVIFQIGWAAVQVSHLSLIPELSRDDHVRSHLTAIRYGFTVFSNIFVYLVTWTVLRIGGECDQQIGPKDEGNFHYVVYIGIAVGTLASLAFHINSKEEDNTEQYEQILATNSANHIQFLRESRLYQVALVYMCSRMFVNVTQMLVPLYLHRTLLLPSRSLAVIPLTMYIGSLSAAAVQRLLPRSIGRKVNFLGGALTAVGACIWIYFGEGSTYKEYLIYCVALFLGFGGSVMLVTSLTLTSDLVGAKTDASAFVYGLMSFTDKLACGIAISIIQKFAMDTDQEYYRIVLVVVGCVTGIVGLLAALLLPRFNSQDVADDLGTINPVENSPLLQPRA